MAHGIRLGSPFPYRLPAFRPIAVSRRRACGSEHLVSSPRQRAAATRFLLSTSWALALRGAFPVPRKCPQFAGCRPAATFRPSSSPGPAFGQDRLLRSASQQGATFHSTIIGDPPHAHQRRSLAFPLVLLRQNTDAAPAMMRGLFRPLRPDHRRAALSPRPFRLAFLQEGGWTPHSRQQVIERIWPLGLSGHPASRGDGMNTDPTHPLETRRSTRFKSRRFWRMNHGRPDL